ncbi:MAG: serine protease [Pseudanabaena frigida]|uniref:Serine protease n=1 Tax=Pseudanabaena frigida TaxID=945775 RepID=A0A2W4YBK7_9CYAN|nr:MAG: serine protease [Pseudanabaena frigida]
MNFEYRKFQKPVLYSTIFLMGASVALGGRQLLTHNNAEAQGLAPVVAESIAASRMPIASDMNFVTATVQKDGGAVVRIDSSRTIVRNMPDISDPFSSLFDESEIPNQQRKEVLQGTGSGFIFSNNGEILTNAHVVSGADKVTVTLKDGRSFNGKVLGADTVTDVAVVKIDAPNLPVISLGDSDRIQPGEWAIAIGNPLGLDNTVTSGIVSATGRSSSQVGIPDQQVQYIQTDAAINPGNSGGPLLNQRGEVIGMNTAIIKGAQGIGFAIPINKAKSIAQQLISQGKVDHPYLGVQMVGITPEVLQKLPEKLKVNSDRGVLIVAVQRNSPAANAGLKAGDVIVKFNNTDVNKPENLQKLVQDSAVGSNLQLEVNRSGQQIKVSVQVGTFPNRAG